MRTQSGVTASAGQSPEIPPSRGKSWLYVNLEQNNVKLLVVSAPDYRVFDYPVNKNFYTSLQRFCDTLDVDYLSFHSNFKKVGFNANDFRDLSHLNVYGADKATRFLTKFLIKKKYFEIENPENIDIVLNELRNQFLEIKISAKFEEFHSWKSRNTSLTQTDSVYESTNVYKVSRKNTSESSYIATKSLEINKGSNYKVSILAKKAENSNFFGFRLAGIYPNKIDATFDLKKGQVRGMFKEGNVENEKAIITPLKDGWFKCTLIGKVNSDKIQVLFGPTNEHLETSNWESKISTKANIFIVPSTLKIEELLDKEEVN